MPGQGAEACLAEGSAEYGKHRSGHHVIADLGAVCGERTARAYAPWVRQLGVREYGRAE